MGTFCLWRQRMHSRHDMLRSHMSVVEEARYHFLHIDSSTAVHDSASRPSSVLIRRARPGCC